MFYTLALITGVMILIQTIINSELAQKIGIFNSTFFNFLISSVILVILMIANLIKFDIALVNRIPIYAYIGCILGVFIIITANYIIPKMSIFKSTLLMFLGQVLTGIVIDMMSGFDFSPKKSFGLALIITGMLMNNLIPFFQNKFAAKN
jgi:transporter family-2 protein